MRRGQRYAAESEMAQQLIHRLLVAPRLLCVPDELEEPQADQGEDDHGAGDQQLFPRARQEVDDDEADQGAERGRQQDEAEKEERQ